MASGERQVVRHVRPLSAIRVAFALGVVGSAIVAVGVVALYLLAAASGALGSVEGFIGSFGLAESGSYHISLTAILPALLILSALGSAAFAALAGVLALLYNSLSDLVGGLEVVTRPR